MLNEVFLSHSTFIKAKHYVAHAFCSCVADAVMGAFLHGPNPPQGTYVPVIYRVVGGISQTRAKEMNNMSNLTLK